MMKQLILAALCAAAMLTSCTSKAQNQQKANDDATREAIRQRVETIYQSICDAYPDHDSPENESFSFSNLPNFDTRYGSKSWNQLLAEVHKVDEESDVEIGFFDFDYWIMGQDWDRLRYENVKVTRLEGDHATATLDWYNMDHCNKMTLELVLEDGEWRIDNIIDDNAGDGTWHMNLRQSMEEYVEDGDR